MEEKIGTSARTPADELSLPFPPTPSATAGDTLAESTHKRREEPSSLPADVPNIPIVLLDDVGFGLSGAVGGEMDTPTFTRIGKNTATVPEVLQHYESKTGTLGKWHNSPVTHTTAMGHLTAGPPGAASITSTDLSRARRPSGNRARTKTSATGTTGDLLVAVKRCSPLNRNVFTKGTDRYERIRGWNRVSWHYPGERQSINTRMAGADRAREGARMSCLSSWMTPSFAHLGCYGVPFIRRISMHLQREVSFTTTCTRLRCAHPLAPAS